jgi:hypothetical protein
MALLRSFGSLVWYSFVFLLLVLVIKPAGLLAQTGTSGTVTGVVKDPSGAVVPGANVAITDPVSGYMRSASSGSAGDFAFANVPFNPYHLTVTLSGFNTFVQDVDVRSPIAIKLDIGLTVGTTSATVTVTESASDILETDPTTHTDVDRGLFEKLPLESQSSSLSSLVTLASPGIAADSNGLFHGLGDHAENSFSLDGQPITDQQSKVFSNQIPVNAVQSLEVIEGAPPAEYGDKTSVVIDVTTRSGLGQTQPHGDVTASVGSFGTTTESFDVGFGGKSWGDFISADGLNTSRFLDGPELAAIHDHGNEENIFDRADYKFSSADQLSLNLGFTRSWFQTPNSYDAENATAWNGVTGADGLICLVVCTGGIGPDGKPVGPQDQRSQIDTYNISPSWSHVINSNTVLTLGGFLRQDQYTYSPSADPFADLTPDLQLQTIGQNRRLTNAGARGSLAYVKGIHNVKAGITYENTNLSEKDTLGIVDPTLNAVCLNADGSPDTNPSLTNPTACTGPLSQNPNFSPLLACYDLTRTAPLPASDNCPAATSGQYTFHGNANIREMALYVEDQISKGNFTFNLGLRGDFYQGLTSAQQIEPRLGAAYRIKPSNTILRLSYARTMETPFNENLYLSSEGCNDAVVSAIMASTITPCVSNSPLTPGWRNEFHAGLQQAFSKYFVLDGEYIWKYTHLAYDFSVLGDTPITFPIEWARSKIPGFALRGSVPQTHGFSAFIVMSSVAARFFNPQESGIGATPGGPAGAVFRIDHDERFNQTTHIQYQPFKRAPWVGFNWRYDSGLVAGPVPCAGGESCANGPAGTDSVIDTSGISPDQQFEAGLFCGSVRATPTTPISSNLGLNLCPASAYGSNLVKIPAAGTEDDDHNPPRIAPRSLFDLSVGDDDLFHFGGDRYKWSLQFTVINLANTTALYNFLSTFSGTHYVTPRTFTAQLGFHF